MRRRARFHHVIDSTAEQQHRLCDLGQIVARQLPQLRQRVQRPQRHPVVRTLVDVRLLDVVRDPRERRDQLRQHRQHDQPLVVGPHRRVDQDQTGNVGPWASASRSARQPPIDRPTRNTWSCSLRNRSSSLSSTANQSWPAGRSSPARTVPCPGRRRYGRRRTPRRPGARRTGACDCGEPVKPWLSRTPTAASPGSRAAELLSMALHWHVDSRRSRSYRWSATQAPTAGEWSHWVTSLDPGDTGRLSWK